MVNEMTINTVRVRNKQQKRSRLKLWPFVVAAVLLTAAAPLAYDAWYGRLGIIGPQPVIAAEGTRRIIKVPPGGNVQAAIEMAESGDIVELQAGAVYAGEVKLPNKPLTDFVTIQSSSAANLPADKRVTPTQRTSMATIRSGILGRPAVSAANGAHHYRFIGIEFTAASSGYNYGLVVLGSGESRVDRVPHDFEIDRCYIHPFRSGVSRRGIALNSAGTTIKNSYIEGFAFPGEETQGICGWTGTRNVRILNNYIEGGAENIMFGGADPESAELIPMDIEVRGNHLNKPEAWVNGKATLKTLFELKNAKRVQFTGNLLTNNWIGSAFRITVRNQDGAAPFSTIEDVTIRDNIVDGAGDGIGILGKDDSQPSQVLKRLTIENNLFLNIGDGKGFEGSGYFILVTNGVDILIANNTVFNTGNITTFYNTMPEGFVFRDNITGHGSYGIHGIEGGIRSPLGRAFFQNNVFMNSQRVDSAGLSFPQGNTLVGDMSEVGFANAGARDFRLTPNSRFKGKGTNRTDVGVNQGTLPAYPQ
jgi:hypothetical protein